MAQRPPNIAGVDATGAVGAELMDCTDFPYRDCDSLRPRARQADSCFSEANPCQSKKSPRNPSLESTARSSPPVGHLAPLHLVGN
jgi:hypothetical protein